MAPEGNNTTTTDTRRIASGDNKSYHIRFSRLTKTVRVASTDAGLIGNGSISKSFSTRNQDDQTKVILNSLSGYAAPGELLSIMGPSGSGKTSLMNVLSGRSSYQSGVVSINGEPVTPHSMKRLMTKIAYVKQSDIFFEHLTVRDQLTYTALLRMPGAMRTEVKHEEVNKVIRVLRLTKVADSSIRLLSGGEKKRVNIGTELLTNPGVLLLDEPTSGLDSTSAVALLKLLHSFADQNGKTVITSIHQPSSAVFRSFDRLMMLSDGHVVYFGTPVESLEYLRRLDLACPDGYNAADHWMDLLVIDSALENDDKGDQESDDLEQPVSPRLALQHAWNAESVANEMDCFVVERHQHNDASEKFEKFSKYNTGWATQYYILMHRALKNSRSAIFTYLNLTKSVAIGVVAGVLWFQMEYSERNVNDIRSYYFFTMTFWVFDSMFNALTAFPTERTVILKERASGSYHLSAYFLAKTTSDAPVRLLLPFIYMTVSFWMIGVDRRVPVFVGTIGCTLLSVLAGEAIGLLVGASIYDLQKAITTMTVGTLALMLLGGFFVENIPDFIEWAKFLSPFKYAFDSSLLLIFDRRIACDGSGVLQELCGNGAMTGFADSKDVRDFIGLQGSMPFNVGCLLVLCFVPRYFAYLALRAKKSNERTPSQDKKLGNEGGRQRDAVSWGGESEL
eukprot:scaffold7703_cov185-Amphora_coffeaeformis.AAC.1